MSFFITGTDTDVGKTYVSRLLIQALREEGHDAVGYKPVSCGDRIDAEILAEASGNIPIDEVNPLHFNTPVSPYVATMLENKVLDPAALVQGFRDLASKHQQVIVEGAGGWEVPLAPNYRISDFAQELALPVVLVAGNRIGTLSHVLLTIHAIQARGLTCAGIFLNQLEDEMDTAMITNKGVIEDLTGVPLLDHLIHGQEFIDISQLL